MDRSTSFAEDLEYSLTSDYWSRFFEDEEAHWRWCCEEEALQAAPDYIPLKERPLEEQPPHLQRMAEEAKKRAHAKRRTHLSPTSDVDTIAPPAKRVRVEPASNTTKTSLAASSSAPYNASPPVESHDEASRGQLTQELDANDDDKPIPRRGRRHRASSRSLPSPTAQPVLRPSTRTSTPPSPGSSAHSISVRTSKKQPKASSPTPIPPPTEDAPTQTLSHSRATTTPIRISKKQPKTSSPTRIPPRREDALTQPPSHSTELHTAAPASTKPPENSSPTPIPSPTDDAPAQPLSHSRANSTPIRISKKQPKTSSPTRIPPRTEEPLTQPSSHSTELQTAAPASTKPPENSSPTPIPSPTEDTSTQPLSHSRANSTPTGTSRKQPKASSPTPIPPRTEDPLTQPSSHSTELQTSAPASTKRPKTFTNLPRTSPAHIDLSSRRSPSPPPRTVIDLSPDFSPGLGATKASQGARQPSALAQKLPDAGHDSSEADYEQRMNEEKMEMLKAVQEIVGAKKWTIDDIDHTLRGRSS